MNRDALVSLVVAGVCVAALGVSATTLNSTVTTEPDDVIDLNYERLPIDPEDVESFKEEIEPEQVPKQPPSKAPPEVDDRPDVEVTPTGEQASQFDGGGREGGGSGTDGSSGGSGPGGSSDGSSDDRGFDLPEAALEPLALLAALSVAAAAGYRYRHRLRASLSTRRGGDETDAESAASPETWPAADPDDEVDRAWLEMVRRLDVDRPHSRTPAECAEAAVAEGMNAEAARTIARLFEEVHYGGEPVTDGRRERARRSAARLDGGDV